jgi:hypothetical protein
MRATLRAGAVAVGIAAIALPGVALAGAAKPVANGNYCMNCTKKLAPGDFHVAKDGKSIDNWTYYNDCAPVPVRNPPKIAIKNGSFSFKGKLPLVTGKKVMFTIKGHFVSSKQANGLVNASGGGKSCNAVPFKAKYTRTGAFTF